MTRGHNYLRGFIGSASTKYIWINNKISIWVAAIETLSKTTIKWPQTAYAGFTFCLQNERLYFQHVVAGIGAQLAPLKRMIWGHFLPSLIGIPLCEIDKDYQNLFTHSVKTGGLAVCNPCKTAEYALETRKMMTRNLVTSLVENDVLFDAVEHRRAVSLASVGARKERLTQERLVLEECGEHNPATKRRDERACKAGLWLSVYPGCLNSTILAANECRDNVRLRYNHVPLDMHEHCDGCRTRMIAEHALSCKKGDLVHIRHDDAADKWRRLCGCAFSFGRVEHKSVGKQP